MRPADHNCLSHWFPTLEATGVPVPRTRIVRTNVALDVLLDGETPEGFELFVAELATAANQIGYPLFLRTGHTSGKFDWSRTCYVERPQDLVPHVGALVEFSSLVDILGLPTSTWAVRELLPLVSSFTAFRGLPIAIERRFFIRDGSIVCSHPYWPPTAIRNPSRADWAELLASQDEVSEVAAGPGGPLRVLVERVAEAFDGQAWSIDFALTQDGRWVALDMAEAARSYHAPGCPHAAAAAPCSAGRDR